MNIELVSYNGEFHNNCTRLVSLFSRDKYIVLQLLLLIILFVSSLFKYIASGHTRNSGFNIFCSPVPLIINAIFSELKIKYDEEYFVSKFNTVENNVIIRIYKNKSNKPINFKMKKFVFVIVVKLVLNLFFLYFSLSKICNFNLKELIFFRCSFTSIFFAIIKLI